MALNYICRDGYKIKFQSNKCVFSKYGIFIGKGYDSEGLFLLSLAISCFNYVNSVSKNIESNAWHSHLCHIFFSRMTCLANMILILKFIWSKVLMLCMCAPSKQPRKSHKPSKMRDLAPLELGHSNLCKMNDVLTKCGK